MSGQLFFRLPDQNSMLAKVVALIPRNWGWVDGFLRRPKIELQACIALRDVGYVINRSGDARLVKVTSGGRIMPVGSAMFEITVNSRMPGFIRFDEAGYDHTFPFKYARTICKGLLQRGCRGRLSFFSADRNNSKYDNPARCFFLFQPWIGKPIDGIEQGYQPARVRIEWSEENGGSEADIASLVHKYRMLGLQEYIPAPNDRKSL